MISRANQNWPDVLEIAEREFEPHLVTNSDGEVRILEDVVEFARVPLCYNKVRIELFRDENDTIILEEYIVTGELADELHPFLTRCFRDYKPANEAGAR